MATGLLSADGNLQESFVYVCTNFEQSSINYNQHTDIILCSQLKILNSTGTSVVLVLQNHFGLVLQ